MLGAAALAMWWDMAPAMRDEFEHWHSHEHFPERLALPGFRRASRWSDADGGEGFFVLYEVQDLQALASPEYLARLNAPTPWSRAMMPHHRNMVRSPSTVLFSRGSAIAAHAVTVRFSAAPGREESLAGHLRGLVEELAARKGMAGAHVLRNESLSIAPTTEQRIRGLADRPADWILLATGYGPPAVRQLAGAELSVASLQAHGAAPAAAIGHHALRMSAVAEDVVERPC